MHEALAQQYVQKAIEYERADSDCHPLPGSAEQLTFALVAVARQRDASRDTKLADELMSYAAWYSTQSPLGWAGPVPEMLEKAARLLRGEPQPKQPEIVEGVLS